MRRRGISMVELMLAVTILGLALVPLLTVFFSAGRESRQTSDTGLALTLSQKVAEELHLSAWENPHLAEELDATDLSMPVSVLEGGSPFFRVVEDQAAPYGQLKAGEDPGITREFGALHLQLKSFQLGALSRVRSLDTTGEVVDVRLDARWSDFQQKPRQLALDVPLPRTVSRPDTPPEVADRASADRAIRDTLYPGNTASLEALAGAGGVELALVRQVGDAVVLARSFAAAETAHRSAAARAEDAVRAADDPFAKARLTLVLARLRESRAAAHVAVMNHLGRTVGGLPELAGRLAGTPLAPPGPAVREAGYLLLSVPDLFDFELAAARSLYVTAYNRPLGEALPARVRTRVFMKAAELTKLRILTTAPGELALLRQMLSEFERYQEPRNPSFASFARMEREHAVDVESLSRRAGAWRAAAYAVARASVQPLPLRKV